MKNRSLLAQVLAVNLVLVALTVLAATLVASSKVASLTRPRELAVYAGAIVATLAGNWLLLRGRFGALDQLISTMETIDLAKPPETLPAPGARASAEVQRLQGAFQRM